MGIIRLFAKHAYAIRMYPKRISHRELITPMIGALRITLRQADVGVDLHITDHKPARASTILSVMEKVVGEVTLEVLLCVGVGEDAVCDATLEEDADADRKEIEPANLLVLLRVILLRVVEVCL
jgi:hypothetical protein